MKVSLRTIIYIDEYENFIRTSYRLLKEWFDSKLIFQNLKTDTKNLVNPQDKDEIWIPYLIELRSESEEKCKRGTDKEVFEVLSNDDNVFEHNSINQHENAFLFEVFQITVAKVTLHSPMSVSLSVHNQNPPTA